MTKLDVSLTEDLKAFLEQQAAAGGYRSAAAYVEDVLRQLWKHNARGALEAKVMEGINSGPPIEVTPDFWVGLKTRVHQRAARVRP